MALLHEEDDHIHKDEKKKHSAEDRFLSEPQKAHPTGEFIIVAKFGSYALRHLASRLGGRETKNLVLANFLKSILKFL